MTDKRLQLVLPIRQSDYLERGPGGWDSLLKKATKGSAKRLRVGYLAEGERKPVNIPTMKLNKTSIKIWVKGIVSNISASGEKLRYTDALHSNR